MRHLAKAAIVARALIGPGLLAATLGIAGCGDSEPAHQTLTPEMVNGAAAAAPPAPAAGSPAAGGVVAPAVPSGANQAPLAGQADRATDAIKQQLLDEVRKRKFKNEDFIESESNRDPFRSFLSDFSGGQQIAAPQYEILMSKYSLDEIKLAMVVGPPTEQLKDRVVPASGGHHVEPRAMFIDSSGMGWTVVRNKHISKSDARVIRIEPETGKVYVEIKEDLGNGKFRLVERVLELHRGEASAEGNP